MRGCLAQGHTSSPGARPATFWSEHKEGQRSSLFFFFFLREAVLKESLYSQNGNLNLSRPARGGVRSQELSL